jgi:hypothetical protein
VSQSSGLDTDLYPLGVPASYSWYDGDVPIAEPPPSDFTALTGWGQVYPQNGATNVPANVYVRNFRTYVHLIGSGWRLVQDQLTNSVVGGHFVADFSSNAANSMMITRQPDGSVRMASPKDRFNDHFWIDPRGTYAAGTIDGVFVMAEMRIDRPEANLIANLGADWWRTATAAYVDPVGTNNPGVGMSSWVKLTTNYQYLFFTNLTKSQLEADPPPPLASLSAAEVGQPDPDRFPGR